MLKNRLEISFAVVGLGLSILGLLMTQYQSIGLALALGVGFSIYCLSYQHKLDIRSFCLGIFPLFAGLLGYPVEVLLFFPLLCVTDSFFKNKFWMIGFCLLLFAPVFTLGSGMEKWNQYLLLGPIFSVILLRYTQDKKDRIFLETLCVLPLLFLRGEIQTELSMQLAFTFLVILGIINRQSSFFILASILFVQSFIEITEPIRLALMLAGMSGVFGSAIFLSALFLFAQGNLLYPYAAIIVGLVLISRVLEEREKSFLDRAWIFSLPILFVSLKSLHLQLSVEILICLVVGIILNLSNEFSRHLFQGKIFSTQGALKNLGEPEEASSLKPESETNWNNNLAPTSSRFIRFYEFGLGLISTGFVFIWFYFS